MATVDRYKIKVDVDGTEQVKNLDQTMGMAQKRLLQLGAAGAVALTALAKSAIGTAKQLSDLAGTAGMTAGQLFQMGKAAEQAGGNFDQVGQMLLRFSAGVDRAVEGGDQMIRNFSRIGVSAQDLETLDDQQLFRKVVQGLGAMEDGAEKTALSILLLGKQAATTNLAKFGESLDRAVDPAIERRLETAAQAVRNLDRNFRELQMAALAALEPILEKLNEFEFNADSARKVIQVLGALTAAAFSAATVLLIAKTITAIKALAIAIRAAATAQALLTALIPGIGTATVIAAIAGATGAYFALGQAIGEASDEQEKLNDIVGQGGQGDGGQIRTIQQTAEDLKLQAVRRTTIELKEQNRLANEQRKVIIDSIGLETDRARILQANAQAEVEANSTILQLENTINDEKARGEEANEAIIAHLEYQQELVRGQLVQTKLLNEEEFNRLKFQRQLRNEQEILVESMKLSVELGRNIVEQDTMLARIRGEMSEEEQRFQQQIAQLKADHYSTLFQFEEQLRIAKLQGNEEEVSKIQELMGLEAQRFNMRKEQIETMRSLEEQLSQSTVAGVSSAMEQLAKQFTPYQMAQDAILQGWNRIGSAIDEFVQTGKFKFKDFARSVLQDLLAMIIRAQVFRALSASMGVFGIPIPGRQKGGPVSANSPYIVGEKGPELFVPKSAGTVIPNNRLSSNTAPAAGVRQEQVTNNYITNNISAIDSKSVAQLFAENRKTLLGTVQMAQREVPF